MTRARWTSVSLAGALCLACGAPREATEAPVRVAVHSSALAISSDGTRLFVANPDADSISIVDAANRVLEQEVALGPRPAADPDSGAYAPAVMPRALALSPDEQTLYVTGERAGALYALDVRTGAVTGTVQVGSEPVGVVVAPSGDAVYVACSADGSVVQVDARSLSVVASASVPNEPWSLALSGDGRALFVTDLMGPGVTLLDPSTLSVVLAASIPEVLPRGDRRLAHGEVRGLYDTALRPGTSELWTAHLLLGTDTAQPDLDFESTAFPALSISHTDGSFEQTLTTDASDVPGVDGAFFDVLSGPAALAFTPDGDAALMVDANSEDVLVVDARERRESGLVRPLPGALPDAIVVAPDGKHAYVAERNSNDIAVLALARSGGVLGASVDGAPISTLEDDPMPATLRLGQHLFHSANSSEFPVTTDHWIACATCHIEGRSDEVTWKFSQGPRDTPSNAGGVLETGFLFRTADRTQVEDYWHTINVEQGGRFDPDRQADLLSALTAYVNLALPLPIPPTTDPALVARGADVFQASGCASCHSGPWLTDSGQGNPTLDLAGTILLHDVGTCVTSGPFPDVAHAAVNGDPRAACGFDTPTLRGIASSPPYLHDGSAATLEDATALMPNAPVAADDLRALTEYLRSL